MQPQPIPPQPAQELSSLLSNPLLLAFCSLFCAWLAARVVRGQVRSMGLEREEGGFRWASFFSTVAFWAVLTLGLLGISSKLELRLVSQFLQHAFDLLLRAGLAGAILAAAGAFADVLAREAPAAEAGEEALARARRERHTVLLAGGVLAVAAATGLSVGTWFLIAIVAIPAVLLFRNAAYRARAADVLSDVAAGLRLRPQFPLGNEELRAADRSLRLEGTVGFLRTWVREDGRKRLVRNEELLGLFAPEESEGSPPPREEPEIEPGGDSA